METICAINLTHSTIIVILWQESTISVPPHRDNPLRLSWAIESKMREPDNRKGLSLREPLR
jgi:hypothetical protein